MKPDFYGWNVVGAAFTALFVVYSIQFSFGTFVDDIVDDTGWSETRLQLIFAVYIFTYSSLSAVTGALTDRVGPRRVVAVGAGATDCRVHHLGYRPEPVDRLPRPRRGRPVRDERVMGSV